MKDFETIVDGCKKGQAKQQKKLYEHYYGYALKVVFRYIYYYEKATDVVNDGFVKVFKSINRFRHAPDIDMEVALLGWMKRIFINTAIDELRKNQMIPEAGILSEEIWQTVDLSAAADQKLLYRELIEQARRLTPAYRAVFNLHVIDGYSHPEIANLLGISVGTSKSNLSQAREQLKKIIKNDIATGVCNY